MRIEARGLGKRYGAHWVVRDFAHDFAEGSRTAVTGPNGSGKSTLIRMLADQLLPTSGETRFSESGTPVPQDRLYRRVSLCAPYVELIEELSGAELVDLHARLRGFRQNLRTEHLWERVGWARRVRRQSVASYSSGMKQRVKLLLALATESACVLLDEPTSNLDEEGIAWYRALTQDWLGERTLIVASNEARDFVDCAATVSRDRWAGNAASSRT